MVDITTVTAGANPPALPPSVEEAYRKKCIELRRRTIEVEESNDIYRLRKARIQRGIRKMRLERAYLLEILGKRMNKNSDSVDAYMDPHDEDSEGSSEAPPTPNEKPLRSKRSHRRPVSSPPPTLGHQQHRSLAPLQSQPTSAFEPPRDPFRESLYQNVPTTNGHPPIQYPRPPSPIPTNTMSPGGQALRQAPAVPPSAFQEFLHRHILPQRDRYQYRNEDDAINIARHVWQNSVPIRREFEDIYMLNMGKYTHQLQQFNLMNEGLSHDSRHMPTGRTNMRGGGDGDDDDDNDDDDDDDKMEVKSELQPPPPSRDGLEHASSKAGGTGGFTSING